MRRAAYTINVGACGTRFYGFCWGRRLLAVRPIRHALLALRRVTTRRYCSPARLFPARHTARHGTVSTRLGATTWGRPYVSLGFVHWGLLALRRVTTRRYGSPARPLPAGNTARIFSLEKVVTLAKNSLEKVDTIAENSLEKVVIMAKNSLEKVVIMAKNSFKKVDR